MDISFQILYLSMDIRYTVDILEIYSDILILVWKFMSDTSSTKSLPYFLSNTAEATSIQLDWCYMLYSFNLMSSIYPERHLMVQPCKSWLGQHVEINMLGRVAPKLQNRWKPKLWRYIPTQRHMDFRINGQNWRHRVPNDPV